VKQWLTIYIDLAASNTIDGGVFVVSGRTAAYRSSVVCAPDFIENFTNETWFFGIGPLHADDDNCMTRWLVNKGWKIKFQHSADALMHTSLGVDGFRKYQCQCLRWVRTTWRSNSTSLFRDGKVWSTQPWCVYAVYFSSFFNFALFTDAALVVLGYLSFKEMGIRNAVGMTLLVGWILGSKLVKILPHFSRNPGDVLYFPVYVLFGYYHSFIKLWALFTVHSLSWGSRPNVVA
jgi:cellulose synthase/poly-beta-1,6-N-acetylglucosamine synthase-like glycosyltransferase